MAAGSIIIDLLMKTGSFQSDTKKASNYLNNLKKDALALGSTMATVGVAVAAAGTTAAVVWAKSVASTGKEVSRLSELSNTSAESFQKMAYASQTVGIEQEKLSDIFKDVQDRVGDFMTTGAGPMADFFENIAPKVGVTADQFARLSGPEALQLFYDSLEKAGVSQSQMIFYMEQMASDSSLLAPLLARNGEEMKRLGDEASRFGGVMNNETVQAAKELDQNLQRLETMFKGLSITIANEILPEINEFIRLAIDSSTETDGLKGSVDDLAGQGSIKTWLMDVGSLLAGVADFAISAANAVRAFIAAAKLTGAATGNLINQVDATLSNNALANAVNPSMVKETVDRANASQKLVNDVLAEFTEATGKIGDTKYSDMWGDARNNAAMKRMGGLIGVGDIGDDGVPTLAPITVGGGGGKKKGGGKSGGGSNRDLAGDYIKQLNEQIALLGKETEYEKALANIQLGKYGKVTEAQKNEILGRSQTLDFMKEQTEEAEKYQKFIDDITGADKLKQHAVEVGFLRKAWEEGTIGPQEYDKYLSEINEKYAESTGEMSEFAKQASANIQDQLGTTLEDILSGNFDNIGKAWQDLLRKMVAQAIAAQLNEALFGKGADGGGGWFKTIAGAIAGAFTGGPSTVGSNAGLPNYGGSYGFGSIALADGGPVFGAGTSTSDSIPAWLSNGEHVVNAKAASQPGVREFLDAMNSGRAVIRRAQGGSVGMATTAALPTGGSNGLTIINQTTGRIDSVKEARLPDGEKALIIQEAKKQWTAELADPNSDQSQAIQKYFNTEYVR